MQNVISSANESVPGKLFILFQAGALFCFVSSLLREQPRRSAESYNNFIKDSRQLEGECGICALDYWRDQTGFTEKFDRDCYCLIMESIAVVFCVQEQHKSSEKIH